MMSDLPVCKLCDNYPVNYHTGAFGVKHHCDNKHCTLNNVLFTSDQWRTLMGEPCLTMPYAYEIEWPTDSEGSTEAILCKPWEDSDSQKDFDVANINGFDITPLYREKDILNPKCKCGCGAPSSLECYEIPED